MVSKQVAVIIIIGAVLVAAGVLAAVHANGGSGPVVLYEGEVTLSPGSTVVPVGNSGLEYVVGNATVYGVLEGACTAAALPSVISDRDWNPRLHSQVLCSVGEWAESEGAGWNCTVNGEAVLLGSAEDGILSRSVRDGDKVLFFYAPDGAGPEGAEAEIRISVRLGGSSAPAHTDSLLALSGVTEAVVNPAMYQEALRCHGTAYIGPDGGRWSGVPVWFFIGVVDGRESPHHPMLSSSLAASGYSVTFAAGNESLYTSTSADLIRNNRYILASMKDGVSLPAYALVGPGMEGEAVTGITALRLVDIAPPTAPEVRVVRYAADGTAVLNETTVNTTWMAAHLPVAGDGESVYRFQGPTFDPADLWNPDESKNPAKVEDAVRGTPLRSLCDLVGGAGPEDRIRLTASDGYVTVLSCKNVYEPLPEQGEAILSWWSRDEGDAPAYRDAPRLYFLAPDGVFGNQNMRNTIAGEEWVYYWTEGVQYPSAAGLSVRGVVEVAVLPPDAFITPPADG
ncbi:hypothetical protein CUJ86_02285 [Methanofollis fontis]|uniref:DUF4430 domain-containing protein n=1 Tax=Methanofollis fontis TaxID=2052832 RepID=A0A483CR39_9EURY|nr:hypothetical protein CUJ86_02285 [Methanofollis fontis]